MSMEDFVTVPPLETKEREKREANVGHPVPAHKVNCITTNSTGTCSQIVDLQIEIKLEKSDPFAVEPECDGKRC